MERRREEDSLGASGKRRPRPHVADKPTPIRRQGMADVIRYSVTVSPYTWHVVNQNENIERRM
jgi:hypothetical protein